MTTAIGPRNAPCAWPVDTTVVADFESRPQAVQDSAVAMATEVLWALSGRRFGVCTVTVRPRLEVARDRDGFDFGRYGSGRSNLAATALLSGAGNDLEQSQVLLAGPVVEVVEVLVDGAVVPPTSYRVDDFRLLVRTDGQEWPSDPDLLLPSTEAGTFQVTYSFGEAVPTGGQVAAGLLAGELAKGFVGDKTCRLPQRARNVTRQGVSVELGDPQTLFEDGRTGIQEVDLWLSAVNPYSQREPSRVFSPDTRRARRQTS